MLANVFLSTFWLSVVRECLAVSFRNVSVTSSDFLNAQDVFLLKVALDLSTMELVDL